MSEVERMRTAYHEAGHVVVELLRGYTPVRVFLDANGVTGGVKTDPALSGSSAIESRLAGALAERMLAGSPRQHAEACGGHDRRDAETIAREWYGAGGARYGVERAEQEARDLVRHHARAITALAHELLRTGEMSGEAARRVVRAHVPFLRDAPVRAPRRHFDAVPAPARSTPSPSVGSMRPDAAAPEHIVARFLGGVAVPRVEDMSPQMRSAMLRSTVRALSFGFGPGIRARRVEYR